MTMRYKPSVRDASRAFCFSNKKLAKSLVVVNFFVTFALS